ncbi:MAG: hypothetical protein H7210_03975, partial [Pyrinomonadaceae bacterium]|nr:hypothetical protein [Phycisphaerales bacterium]
MQNEPTSNSRDSVRAMVRVMGFVALVKAMMISGVMATSQAGAAIDPDSRQPAAAVQPSTSTWAADAAVLRDKTAAPAARSVACRQLLASRDAGARQFLVQLLTPVSEDQEARDVLVREVGQMASGPEWALAPMVELLAAAPVEKRAELLRCMSSIRTREAIRAILNSAKTSTLPEIREAAFTSLRRLTGRDELGSDETRWSDWFAGVEWLPEPEWRRVLAEGLAQYTQSMKSQRDLLLARLLDSERRRCLDAPTEPDRWNILASFLKDDLPALRKLGVELT